MKDVIKCSESVEFVTKEGKVTSSQMANITVENSDGEETIEFYRSRGLLSCFFDIPVKDWAKVKDVVDRLIIRMENYKQK